MPIAQRKGVGSYASHSMEKMLQMRSYFLLIKLLQPSCRIQIPRTSQDALKDLKWKKFVDEEIIAIKSDGLWALTRLPNGKIGVGCKWIFIVKYKSDGSVERFKVRLVTKGFTQPYDIVIAFSLFE